MAKSTIGSVISRIRTQVKAVKQDPFLTDRVIYSFVLKHAKWLMKREDSRNKLLGFSGVLQVMDFVELEEIDKVEACCTGITSDCTIKRTVKKMPIFMQGYTGPLIRTVSSLDGSVELQPTNPSSYASMSRGNNFKYNKTKYYWYLNDRLYFPDLEWDAVRIEGIFEEDISEFTCEADSCIKKSDQSFNVPDYLLAEIEAKVFQDLVGTMQLPMDQANDKQNIIR